jgi:hypothetical protein
MALDVVSTIGCDTRCCGFLVVDAFTIHVIMKYK